MKRQSIVDDAANVSTEPVSQEQIAKLQERILEAGRDVTTFCRAFGIEALDQLPAAKFKAHIEQLDQFIARRGLTHEEIERLDREERDRIIDQDPFLRRLVQYMKEGMSSDEAWDLALAEELNKEGPWSSRLLDLVAQRHLERLEPTLKARWEREVHRPAIERSIINWKAAQLKAQGVRAYRREAEEVYAEVMLGITVAGLKQRRRRERRRRERRK